MKVQKTSSFPSLKVHSYFQGTRRERLFYSNDNVELWNKVLHLIIFFIRTKGNAFISNPGIMNYLKEHYKVKVSLGGVKQAIQKLIYEGYIECTYGFKDPNLRMVNGRHIKLTGKALDHLRIYSTEDKAYQELPKRFQITKEARAQRKSSRGRRLVRKKMYTIVDYVNMKKASISKQYTGYVKSQLKYFNPKTAADEITSEMIDIQDQQRIEILEDIWSDIDVGFDIN